MIYQCGRCGLTRASGQEMGVIQKCKCPFEFNPPVMPQQRTWVGLTNDEVLDALKCLDSQTARLPQSFKLFAQSIESILKEKNT